MAPTTATALVTKGGKLSKETIPVPTPGEHQVLVKISYVAQNPTDVSRIKTGTVIVGLIWGGWLPSRISSFYLLSKVLFEQARSRGWVATATVSRIDDMWRINNIGNSRIAASVGLYAIQIAKYYGLNVVTTCSPRHHDLVKSLGASHAFDYRDAKVVEIIKAATNFGLRYVFDTIGNDSSSVTASHAVSEQGGGLCTVRPGKAFTENVTKQTKVTDVLVWTAFLKEHKYGEFYWPVSHR
ncbi:unnamed protein product [Aspergillus oryzae var. brunneus]|uniref:Unnamed protein product n=1 Tax=Aspergillus oryzae var. brunneus TaxID=332754 RepID=A0ABQ6KZF2_ASPOZ|nr:unnamed protein product [Aspergillus oryzae var. brunneus]